MRKISLGLNSWIAVYICALLTLLLALVVAERLGLRREIIGWTLLGATILLYAVLGFVCRTAVPLQYYAAGRSIPALHNGMATAADWISAASFVSLMGTIYATGYSATVFLMGWTGGFCLLALLVVPYMRKLGEFTLPDFMVRRYGGQAVRLFSALAVVGCCFVYVVAQIFAVGLITSRVVGVDFEIGIYLGLSSVLLCSFLGGMRAITWTQVAQYIVILLATLLSVLWLSFKQTGAPWSVADYRGVASSITQMQAKLASDPGERDVLRIYEQRIEDIDVKIADPANTIRSERERITQQMRLARSQDLSEQKYIELEKQRRFFNLSENAIVQKWRNERAKYVQLQEAAKSQQSSLVDQNSLSLHTAQRHANEEQINFIALVLILCLGTVSMPHLLMRFQTTSTVAQTRTSVSWTLFFILAVYLCLPPLAMMIKLEVLTQIVGTPVDSLPAWLAQWNRLVPELVSFTDANVDGVVQAAELYLATDAVMLVMPEIAGMPYVFTALIAAGGLAAALSTADGLLLAMTAAISRDLLGFLSFRDKDAAQDARADEKTVRERGMLGCKVTLLSVAMVAAYVAAQRPADIVTLVTLAFSLTAATFFVPIVAGIFWNRANRYGAISAMLVGSGLTLYYWFSMNSIASGSIAGGYWLGIRPVAAGVFGVVAAMISMLTVSLLTSRLVSTANEAVTLMRRPD